MRKLAFILILALLMTRTNGSADEWSGYTGTVTNGPAIIYTSAHLSSMPVARLSDGENILLFDTYGGWYYIFEPTHSLKGWIRRENFQFAGLSAKETRSGIVLCETLTLRQTPSTSGNRLLTLHTQQQVIILEEQEDWYHIQLTESSGRATGYVLKDFIATDFSSRIVVSGPIYAYAAPDSGSKKVALIDEGTQLFIIDAYDEFWVITLRGASAFVSMRDLQVYY